MKKSKPEFFVSFTFFASAAFFLSGELSRNYLYAVLFSVLHETGHLSAMAFFGAVPDSVSLDITGIKISKRETVLSYPQECIVALCGPAVNLLFMLIFSSHRNSLQFIINSGLLLVNMLPVRSLDGGRFLFCASANFFNEKDAEKIVSVFEILTVSLFSVVMTVSVASGTVNSSFVLFSVILVVMIVSEYFF